MEIKIVITLLIMIMEMCLASNALPFHGSTGHTSSHVSPLSYGKKRHSKKLAPPTPRKKSVHHKWAPAIAANPHSTDDASPSIALPPSTSPPREPAKKLTRGPLSPPSISYHGHHPRHHNQRPAHQSHNQQGPSMSPYQSPFSSSRIWASPASAPVGPPTSSAHYNMPIFPPSISPIGSILKNTGSPPPSPLLALPPPPPNTDCGSITCTEPLTYTPTGSPCGCVRPIEVKLHLDMAIYAFFPLVSELAEEIAASVGLNHSQVRIMGADADTHQLEKTAVLINLVPRGPRFNPSTAFRIYDKFWRRQVLINDSEFGDYEVLYVHYPGLPPSPPPSPLGVSTADDGPYGGRNRDGMPMKPLGVDVSTMQHNGLGKRMVAVIVISSFTAFVVFLGIGWLLLLKFRSRPNRTKDIPQPLIPSTQKPTGRSARPTPVESAGGGSLESISLSSGTMTYAGSAKIFTLSEMERATSNFEASRVLGEGGFGLVYSGTLDDGREVAVKILKRDDHHGGREFLAEVEMLSRLHHRNLVKLIGICTEGQTRCLVYELVPNGSVESHLHGVDKEGDPLDWDARMKIALGAARGLAYLHEDSNPRVIHRDFKSSNILLEHDFTPKVSDFGLARAALEGNRQISTHVMGTFGYLAPEYAMTGHLLVKSDVYSYGVVLLELLTGRKPVDLSQPPGQENLVAWARPLLTNKEGLETIIDPSIKPEIIGSSALDSIAKLAAIASMCVQPEVSHRPFMGEVVQALKLVCSELDETKVALVGSRSGALGSGHVATASSPSHDFVSCSSSQREAAVDDSNNTRDLLSAAQVGMEGQDLGSFRRFSSSGPLAPSGQRRRFWQRLRSLSWGGISEQGLTGKFRPGSR